MAALILPSLAKIASTLRETTEVLARELVSPGDRPPVWDEFEWRIAKAVSAMQGVSSLLCAGLRWAGPATWRQFLEVQREQVLGRHRKIEQLLLRLDEQARREGIVLVGLKGAALHANGLYRAGDRPMADVDLLVRESDVGATARVLAQCGYELTCTTWRNLLFESHDRRAPTTRDLGESVHNQIKVEVHSAVRERLPLTEVDITNCIFPADAAPGLCGYPSHVSLLMHLLLHAAGNMRVHALRLLQLHDIALLAARLNRSDWDTLLGARPGGQSLWWAGPPLTLTRRYYPAAIPQYATSRLDELCSWLLRESARRTCLTDVSWSNIRISAFPGIEWSRTPSEALRFAAARIWPSADERFELRHFAEHHPGATDVPWYGISQGARIVRWIFFKPPRVQTLLSVRAALAQ